MTSTLEKPMLSYHSDPQVKAKYTERFAAHRAADEVIQGEGFNNGRGCFVGCTLDAYAHSRFPIELGWPEWLAHLADTIFEGISKAEAPKFGTDLLASVPIGVNLEPVRSRFLIMVQRRSLERIKDNKILGADCITAVKSVIELLEKDVASDSATRSAAWSAAQSAARSAAQSAAWSAAELAADSAAWSAARSAARSAAESAADAACSAAWYVSESSAESAWSAAWSAEFKTQRNELLALVRECKEI